MSRVARKHLGRRSEGAYILQITSMVDIFTILLVFLLKSYSTSPVQLTPSKDLKLPQSTSTKDPEEVLKLVVSQDGIYVEDKKVAEIVDGQIEVVAMDKNDGSFITPLYKELDQQAQKSKNIAKENETLKFDGKAIVQADRKLQYGLLKKVMYTSMMAGYADLKLAVVSYE